MENIAFEDFKKLVVGLFARYPSAAMSDATTPAWWQDLRNFPRDALLEAFKRAPRGNPQFCPSCETVREYAAAWHPPTPQPNLAQPALPESEEELPPELAAIRERQKRGEISDRDAMKAFLHWAMEKLP